MEYTEEEYEAFHIIKNIVGEKVNPSRLTRSEAKSYLAVLLDNSTHKTVCRVYLLGRKKYLGTISNRKVETKIEIKCLSDIHRFSGQLREIVNHYENRG